MFLLVFLSLPPLSRRVSLDDDDDDVEAALSVLLSSKGRRVDTSRIDEDTTRGFDRLIKISAASDLRYFYSLIRFFPIGGDHETERERFVDVEDIVDPARKKSERMDRDAFLDSFGEIIADASDAIDEAILVFSKQQLQRGKSAAEDAFLWGEAEGKCKAIKERVKTLAKEYLSLRTASMSTSSSREKEKDRKEHNFETPYLERKTRNSSPESRRRKERTLS